MWRKVLTVLKPPPSTNTADTSDDQGNTNDKFAGIKFKLANGLVYFYSDISGRERLCIPLSVEKDVFEICYDNHFHVGFYRALDHLNNLFYVRQAAKRLRTYIKHCTPCNLNQTTRHKLYGALNPVPQTARLFEIVSLDWIIALPPIKDGYD
jgi:hypothetical protein